MPGSGPAMVSKLTMAGRLFLSGSLRPRPGPGRQGLMDSGLLGPPAGKWLYISNGSNRQATTASTRGRPTWPTSPSPDQVASAQRPVSADHHTLPSRQTNPATTPEPNSETHPRPEPVNPPAPVSSSTPHYAGRALSARFRPTAVEEEECPCRP